MKIRISAATAALAIVLAGMVVFANSDKLVGGAYDFGGGSCFDETSTAPSTATAGFSLANINGHPGRANRVALMMDLATRNTWDVRIHCYSAVTTKWHTIEPVVTNSVGVTVASKNITVQISSDTIIPWELGGHCDRLAVEHVTAAGGALGAEACLVGN